MRLHLQSIAALVLSSACLVLPNVALAERMEPAPKQLEGVGLSEKLGARVPSAAPFRDTLGNEVTLGDYLGGGRPTILTLNYSNCPMLCSVQLNAFVKALRGVGWTPGREFQLVTISLDPAEGPARARQTQQRYLRDLGRPEASWHFLTGPESSIRAVADAVGFAYRYSEERKEFLHVPALILLTDDGRVARYLYGIMYEPNTVRLGLLEAAEGKLSSTVDKLLLYCFHYDADEQRYSLAGRQLMQLGAGAFLGFAALGALVVRWRSSFKRRRRAPGPMG